MATPNPNELEAFMQAIKDVESGGGDYGAIGVPTGDSRGVARGAYQIMSGYWDDWARQAGYAGADWRVPEYQDAVAAYKFKNYYDRYDGNWELVSVAWFAGPGVADKARSRGVNSFQGYADVNIDVPEYARRVMDAFRGYAGTQLAHQQQQANVPQSAAQTFGSVQRERQEQQAKQKPTLSRSKQRELVQASFDEISNYIRNNAGDPEAHRRMRSAMSQFMHGAAEESEFMEEPVAPEPPPEDVRTSHDILVEDEEDEEEEENRVPKQTHSQSGVI